MSEGPAGIDLDYYRTVEFLRNCGWLSVRLGLIGIALGLVGKVGSRRLRAAVWAGCALLLPAAHGACFLPWNDPFRESVVPVLGGMGCLLLMAAARAFRGMVWPELGAWVWCSTCAVAAVPFWSRFFRDSLAHTGVQFALVAVLVVALNRDFGWRRPWDVVCRVGMLSCALGAASVLASVLC